MQKLALHPEYSYRLEGCKAISDYIHGGNGIVTLKSPSGKHRTYQYRYPQEKDKFEDGTMFVYALCGYSEWQYVGMVRYDRFRLTHASRFSADHEITKGADYLTKMMTNPILAAGPMVVYHEGVCCVCGRPLTTPRSIRRGIGPKCRRKIVSDAK